MDLTITVQGSPEGSAIESLVDWLRPEPEFRGRIRESTRSLTGGEMGGAVDALVVAVGSGGVLTVLASTLRSWLQQPRHKDIRITIENGHGSVDIDAKRISSTDIEVLLRQTFPVDYPPTDGSG